MSKQVLHKYLLLLIFLALGQIIFAQNNRKYKKETICFLYSIRSNLRIFSPDTIRVLNLLSNRGLYKYLVFPNNEDWSRGYLSMNERNNFLKSTLDTSKLLLTESLVLKVKLVPFNKEQDYIQFAKPIFYKNYTLCIFCRGYFSDGGAQETFLFKKEKGNWIIIKSLGGISNY